MKTLITVSLLAIAVLQPFLLCAQTDSVLFYVNELKAEETRSHALQKLCEYKDPRTFPLLSAIQEKKIFFQNNEWVTVQESSADKKSIIPLLTTNQPLSNTNTSTALSTDNLSEVQFSRKDRLFITPVLPYINLTHNDVEKRKLAYTQFLNKKDATSYAILLAALENEKHETVKPIGLEVLYSIELYQVTGQQQTALLKKIADHGGPNVVAILDTFIDETPEPSQKEFATTLMEDIDSRARKYEIIQNLFSGLSLGSILMLIALGLAIIYGLAGVINMAHGEFMMIGAYTTFCMQEAFASFGIVSDAFFWISLPASFLVAGTIGLITERIIIRKLYNRPMESLLATWGLSLVLIQLARTIFGDLTAVKTPSLLSGGWSLSPQLVLPYNRVFIICFTAVMIGLTYFFLYRTKQGLRIRAVTQNRNMSACLGIATARVDLWTFFIGSGIAGIAGCCITLIGNVVPDMGQTYIVDSFLVVVTGGVGNLLGTILAGLGIGFSTKFLEPVFQAVYGKVILLVMVIFFLQLKPKGLFPAKGRLADE